MTNGHGQINHTTQLYHTKDNVHASHIPCMTVNRDIQTVNASFGSTVQFTINPNDFSRNVMLRLVLPSLAINQTLCGQWGYHIIESVRFRYGSGDEVLGTCGSDMLVYLLSQCNTNEKKQKILELAGQNTSGVSANPEANILLKLPSSSAKKNKKPFPNYMLSTGITVIIVFRQKEAIVSGDSAGTYSSQFQTCEMAVEHISSLDPSSLVHVKNDNQFYDYFWKRNVQQPVKTFSGSSTSRVSIPLLGFQTGKLCGILFYVCLQSDEAALNYNKFASLTNLQLTMNGSALKKFNGKSFELYSVMDGETSGFEAIFSTTTNNTTVYKWYYLHFDSSVPDASINGDEHIVNSVSVANNQLNLEFITPADSPYVFHSQYVYEQVLRIGHDKSVACLPV